MGCPVQMLNDVWKHVVGGVRSAPWAPVDGPLPQLEPLRLRFVNRSGGAALWYELIARRLPVRDRWSGWCGKSGACCFPECACNARRRRFWG